MVTPIPSTPRIEPTVARQQVRGIILEVTARNLNEVALLRIRDAQGREWSFTTDGPVGVSPSHLKEHQAFGFGALVTYTERQGQFVALAILD
ncbi:MAG: hypothetical protein EXR54_02520 [Dehalococcoidia bacterium]|nr:hypothetical protein [Dehalococcoidia bacterium]